ncbi:MAG: phosphate ABC transporter permease subunit PstC, partial [Candidatus Omnitrophica bacterium]|nr:phosphate ABC transporter permease subunit PstC [Candidatus Omnitrophota bacterium]
MLLKRRFILKLKELFIERLLFFFSLLSVATTLGIILVLSFETFEFFKEVPIIKFLTDTQWTP